MSRRNVLAVVGFLAVVCFVLLDLLRTIGLHVLVTRFVHGKVWWLAHWISLETLRQAFLPEARDYISSSIIIGSEHPDILTTWCLASPNQINTNIQAALHRSVIKIILLHSFRLSLQSSSPNHVQISQLFLLANPYCFQPNGNPYTSSSQLVCRRLRYWFCFDTPDRHRSIPRSAIRAVLTCRMGCVSCSGADRGHSTASRTGTLWEMFGWCSFIAVLSWWKVTGSCFSALRILLTSVPSKCGYLRIDRRWFCMLGWSVHVCWRPWWSSKACFRQALHHVLCCAGVLVISGNSITVWCHLGTSISNRV